MNLPHDHLTLSDGRNLAYTEYGDPAGFPIFAFHGLPGSRIWFKENDEISMSAGVRLITTDRPGFGLSDQKKGRSFLDFGDDINELARSLEIEEYSVLGISGGGVYSAAMAYKYPDHVYKCGLVSTVNQFENGKPPKEMASQNRTVFTLSKRFPWLMKFILNQQKKMIERQPERYIQSIMSNTGHLCTSDKAIMENRKNAEFLLIHMGEAFKNGVEATVSEAKLFNKYWGFHASKLKVPTELWHGTEDTLSPISPVRKLSDEIPTCNENFVVGKGHFLTEEPEIWERILLSLKK